FYPVQKEADVVCRVCLRKGHDEMDCLWNEAMDRKDYRHEEGKSKDQYNLGNMTPEQQSRMMEVLSKYEDVFAREPNQLGRTSVVQHEIHTEEGPPLAYLVEQCNGRSR
ncbi:4841_t:CDS:2, partial [Ambispora leptoticha]